MSCPLPHGPGTGEAGSAETLTAHAGRGSISALSSRPVLRSLLFLFAISATAQTPYQWDLPKGFPPPRVPADNPMTQEKVELGRRLFYDVRLSANGTQSCASCHMQRLAFTDGKARGEGSTGEKHPRGSMSLVNIAYAPSFTWLDQGLHSLEEQMRVPMFGQHPVELGMDEEKFVAIVRADPQYRGLEPVSMDAIMKAIACFERSIVSARSPYDRYHFDRDDSAVSAAAKRGEVVFFSQPFACFTCHGGPNFTSRPRNDGDFKAPTLRNIAITAPYMHDGSVAALEEAIGHQNLPMTADQKSDLIEFLSSLTDESVLTDPRFAKP